ncbi:DUF547 domain-containing protein [Erythrobacter sp. YT30]|uniref:DUF547 domain-containing protein n=1 Tax=Erythrobacter sp. YT30 TaxID=1735012 RepID=UPI00076DBFE4|nr:DUF547 domain-containing protein [Erythrobacter sp. YT30]KWV91998.1 hypothetical protein AUC45_12645 [Erythrobacter sp. YT30]
MKSNKYLFSAAALAAFLANAPLAAESVEVRAASSSTKTSNPFAQFAPAKDQRDHRIDYQHWDEALGFMVIPMGPSLRDAAPRVSAPTGTRIIYGHRSRYRLEGNRVAFSFLDADIRSALTEYREDLERVGTQLDLTNLPRNEQLAFWINLHNVAVIEALAYEYPLREPAEGEFGSNAAGLQDAKLVNIKGVELSPRDIREKIVYPNWSDPRVIYAFWRGEIGGPSIQRLAFTGDNVDILLSLSAEEFVNSLRGVESYGGALRVSRIYEEARPFYFETDDDLKAHLSSFARDDVKELVGETKRVAFNRYEGAIADLVNGHPDPGFSFVCSTGRGLGDTTPNAYISLVTRCSDEPSKNRAAKRLMFERAQKLNKAYRRGIRTGTVIYGDGRYAEGEGPREVE